MRFILTVILIVFVSIPTLAQFGHLLHKTYAQRFLALDTLYYNNKVASLDSTLFFKEINKLEDLANLYKDEDLALEAELLRIEYYMIGKDYNHNQFIARAKRLKKIADDKGIKHLQVRIRQKLGYFYFYKVQQYGPGFENYLEAFDLMKKMQVSELPDKQEMVASIGTAYYNVGESKLARKFLEEAYHIPPSYKKRLPINNTNTLGLLFRMEEKYDSSEFYLRKAFAMAKAQKDSTWMGITSGNIGINYFIQGRTTEAIPYLKLDIRESLKGREIDNAINSMVVLAKIYMKHNHPDSAKAITTKALSLLEITGDPVRHKVELYYLLAQLYKKAGQLENAYTFLDSSRILNTEILNRKNSLQHQQAQSKIEIERYQSELLKAGHEKRVRELQMVAIIGGLLLISIIFILFLNRKRILLQQSQQQLKSEKESIESELEMAVNQLNEFTAKIREKNQQIENYYNELKAHINETGQPYPDERREVLEQLMQATLLTDAQWDNFLLLFDKVHKGYLIRLREKLPDISPADTRFIILTKLNLTPKEMASMLGVRPDAIRLYRHRLRKKLNLTEPDSVQDLINNM